MYVFHLKFPSGKVSFVRQLKTHYSRIVIVIKKKTHRAQF